MNKILISLIFSIMIIGCGGSGDNNSYSSYAGPMDTTTAYTMSPGDSIVKGSESTIVLITHDEGANISTVELVEGTATILRAP
jgi:uncharacterized lipoprotein YehR (DUF1307 family)